MHAATILFLGCPAEEHGGGKVLLDGAGAFNGLDAAMIIHPASTSTGYDISFAIKRLFVEFFGKAAHAAAAPQKGVNALDAMLSFFNGIALMRQQMTERTRVHGIILNGGQSFNTIPDYTKAEMGIRALRMEEVLELETRLAAVAEGAARATGCTVKVTQAEPPQPEVYVNVPLARTLDANYARVGEKTTMRTYGQGVGSTDVGIVTHRVPGIQGYIDITAGASIPTHSREFAAAASSEYGYEAMLRATKALALTAFDLFNDPGLLSEIQEYFAQCSVARIFFRQIISQGILNVILQCQLTKQARKSACQPPATDNARGCVLSYTSFIRFLICSKYTCVAIISS